MNQTATRKAPNPNIATMSAQDATLNLPAATMGGQAPMLREVRPPGPGEYPPKIAAALVAITRKVGAIAKLGHNTFHKYHYQKWEDVLVRLAPLLIEHGLIIQQSQIASAVSNGDALLSITYEFTIVNEQGEVWPDRPEWTAISRLADAKGVYDDKAANKCHTQAHKYFLIHLFKIRTEEVMADSDGDGGAQTRRRAPNPNAATIPDGPHLIPVGDKTHRSWADAYAAAVKRAKSIAEIQEWERINETPLQELWDNAKTIFQEIADLVTERLDALRPSAPAAPPVDRDVALVTEGATPPDKEEVWGEPNPSAEPAPAGLRDTLIAEVDKLLTVKGCNEWALAAETRRKMLSLEDDKAVDNALFDRRRVIQKKAG